MKLQGRNLSNGTRGDDVRLLHHELRLLGVRLIPDSETRPGIFGSHTLVAVREFQAKAGLKVTGIVDEATAKAINARVTTATTGRGGGDLDDDPFLVRGRVTNAAGQALPNLVVQAYDRDLRREELLGETTTDAAGRYEIRYGPERFSRLDKGNADVVVKALSVGSLLAVSPVMFDAPTEAIVDVVVPAETLPPPTLFERIGNALEPVRGEIQIVDLEEGEHHQDLTFLSGEIGFDRLVLARFAIAHRIAKCCPDLPAAFWFALLGGSHFQLSPDRLGEHTEAFLDFLPALDDPAVRKALTRSLNEKEIPPASGDQIESWIRAFSAFVARRTVSESDRPTFVKAALVDAGIGNPEKQELFAALFNKHKALTPELLAEFRKDPAFGEREVAELSTSFQLAELTRADFSVVRMIKEDFRVHQPADVRRVAARKSESDWIDAVAARHAAGEIELPVKTGALPGETRFSDAEAYGRTLERQFREAFPTAAFAGGLHRALQNGGSQGLRHAVELGRFLDQHDDFELLTTRVDDFLKTGTHDEGFRLEVKAVQRVFKLAPTFQAADTLLADDIHSAQQIYRLGETEFVRRYADRPGFTDESARLAWNRAADTHAAVLTVVADLKGFEAEGLPAALQGDDEALASFPNWNNLFQSGDLCECEHCRSVFGPAAYFADLLMFLRDRKAANPADTVKDILLRRRPDLGFLELDCDNALVPLPYIDVVCEVLENVIAPGENDLKLTGLSSMPSDPVAARAAVAAAFLTQEIDLGPDWAFSDLQISPPDPKRWIVHGPGGTWLLKEAAPEFRAEILGNTKASAAELRAYPQYVNPKAYENLRSARYPMTLPFDLFAEEVRAGFRKTNLQRWELMRVLHGIATPNNATAGQVAAEALAISVNPAPPPAIDEFRLILNPDTAEASQQALWGEEPGSDWLDRAGNVKTFLQKTLLEYEDLLALLDLEFVDPAGDIAVHHLDDSCDTDKKVIKVLNAAKLDRLHRFLRLWRKLEGWELWELDLAIRRLGNQIQESLLVDLHDFNELRKKLGGKMTVEQALALLGKLNTETRFTQLHQPRADGLYQRLFLNRRLVDPAFEIAKVDVAGPTTEKISGHKPAVLGALGIREVDLLVLQALTKASDPTQAYITDDLTLGNLSFLWRHSWLAKQLKFKIEDWKLALKILQQDLLAFSSLEEALEFLEKIDHIKTSGFTLDELDWILSANRLAKAATREADASRFLLALRKELQGIRVDNDPAQTPIGDEGQLAVLLTSLLWKLNRDEPATQLFLDTLRDEVVLRAPVAGLETVVFPATIRILYDKDSQTLRFTGVMTEAERTSLLDDVTVPSGAQAAYEAAVGEIFRRPRLTLKFYEPVFTAPLAALPAAVDFKALADPDLVRKISYDAEQRLLHFDGILSQEEKQALDALSAAAAYRSAVSSLFTQPESGVFPAERLWLEDADLVFPLRDKVAANFKIAAKKALEHLTKTLSEKAVIQQASAQLGLTPAVASLLLTRNALLPQTLLAYLTNVFATTTGVVDYATLKITFDGWFWAVRAATLWNRWKLGLEEIEQILALPAGAALLDVSTLPLDSTKPMASFERLSRVSRLLEIRKSLPETGITLLAVLGKLAGAGPYNSAAFAADVALLNKVWRAADVEQLVTALDLTYPGDYLLVDSWERLRRAFYFLGALNAGAGTVKAFAAATMDEDHARTLKELLRSKFGAETWLTLSVEIQDVLRERKSSALAAYRLAQTKPTDTPTGKWENANDLYAYYLLDVEMGSCQLTSRLVQASGSVQLFVQRCFMGLEAPAVVVNADGADGDSAWRWWKWMRKYRVWEANRKVFIWPENWIEPELRRDKSPFFRDLENHLLQNEIDQENVEIAFSSYLEKLDGVAQLEIAGFFQEDDGDNAIVHVFGRTAGTEPHVYYYRRYDYRQWTTWEKVELDIQGDYLVPAVVNRRLFLFWPVFTEVPDESRNSTVKIPKAPKPDAETEFTPNKTKKRLRLQMAVSEYQREGWTPKKVSKDADESDWYDVEIVKKNYQFLPIDRSEVDGRFGVKYEGYSVGSNGNSEAGLFGAFEISGCRGIPELTRFPGYYRYAVRPEEASTGDNTAFQRWVEIGPYPARGDAPQDDFTLVNGTQSIRAGFAPVLNATPGIFRMTPPWQLSYLDRLWLDGLAGLGKSNDDAFKTPVGSWLPFFYNDQKRTFFVLPALTSGRARFYYPEIKRQFRQWDDAIEGEVRTWVESWDLESIPEDQRRAWEVFLGQAFPAETPPPYTDEQVRALTVRWILRFFHYYLGYLAQLSFEFRQFHFKNFYHPFVCDFARLVHNPLQGIPALMSRETQLKTSGFLFFNMYQPTFWVLQPTNDPKRAQSKLYPQEIVDFSSDGAYSPYNWELFFHAPLMIANSLSQNQRFEEARDWYHFIFNPLGVESPAPGGSPMSKYWITKPFYETTGKDYIHQRIDNILRILAGDTSDPDAIQLKDDLEKQVHDWRTNPFEPHRIANYRTVAYQKTVVMKYLDNLIAWGDALFRQDSMESINEATQLYILAAEILGSRPRRIPPRIKPPVETFNELEKQLDTFSNALVQVENLIPVQAGSGSAGQDPAPLPTLYFCMPHNEKMLGYWDTVADRLYKIRHCMNIEGVVRQLALFEPPIDPGALVKAVAGGVDIGAALSDLNAPLPLYRFNTLLQKANEVCNDVKALGGALLSALEKKDAEALGLLRQSQEIRMLEAVRAVREQQIAEAKENLEGIRRSKAVVETRRNYYRDIQRLIAQERLQLDKMEEAQKLQEAAQGVKLTASIISILPAIDIGASGFGGTPIAKFKIGGLELGQAADLAADVLSFLSQIASNDSARASAQAGFNRRWEDWKLQERLANRELEQFDRQIAAAELRIAITEKELDNQILQIENAKATDAFLHSKYTNQELYQWQMGQISGVYFQGYKLAYDLAKRAERCFRFELGLQDSSYINFGYWDSLKKGLLSGEKLQYDLRRLEVAYLDQNRRNFELTKHVSLALLDPLTLVTLRETGRCSFTLPEEIFDLDYPGHYFRRIKSVSLTLPCVAGPYTTISCTLRLLRNSIRINTAAGNDGYPRNTEASLPADDPRFVESNIPVKAIAASTGQNDSGVFELSFRDERYLPFEGAGAISGWTLELFYDQDNADFGKPLRQLDFSTITDVVLHVRYTAREDAGPFKKSAIAHLRSYFEEDETTPALRLFDLRRELPTQWHRFLHPADPAQGNVLEIEMSQDRFSLRDTGKDLKVNKIWLLARCANAGEYKAVLTPPLPEPPPAGSNALTLTQNSGTQRSRYGNLHFNEKEVAVTISPSSPPVVWRLKMTGPGEALTTTEVQDLYLILGFDWY